MSLKHINIPFRLPTKNASLKNGLANLSWGSVFNFVSLPFRLIPEAGCGQSPQALINARFSANYSW